MHTFWQNKRVLVTGAGGFIGSHLCEELVHRGAQVHAFVRYNSRADDGLLGQLSDEVRSAINTVRGDLRDASAVRSAMEGIDLVFHLGALIAIPYSYVHPEEVIDTNVGGTLNVLLAAREFGTGRVILTSTSEVYGTARTVPIDETHPLQGQSPYSASKIAGDKIAESFYCSFDLPIVTVRPFNTFGPRQSMRAVIPTIIAQTLFNDVVQLGNLDATRDLTYVADTVSGFLRAAEAEGVEGETFNLGNGKEIRIGDLADRIIGLVGKPVTIEIDSTRLRPGRSEVNRLLSDNRRAKDRLQWSPRCSLDDGLTQTIEWIKQSCSNRESVFYQL